MQTNKERCTEIIEKHVFFLPVNSDNGLKLFTVLSCLMRSVFFKMCFNV